MTEYRNRRGKPISTAEWRKRFEDANYRSVSNDVLDGGIQVSTFWIGVDEPNTKATRQIFETLVFGGEFDHRKRRYPTMADAIRGHREIVDKLREAEAIQGQKSADENVAVRPCPIRPWVLALVPTLCEQLRSDARLEVIAGAQWPLGEPPMPPIDLLIQESTRDGLIVPRVAIQCVSGTATSREVRSFDKLATRLQTRCPSLRNGLLIRNVSHIPPSTIQHGRHFDFIAVWNGELPTEVHCGLATVLLDEVQSSRVFDSLITARQDRRKCTLVHRPMFLPRNP